MADQNQLQQIIMNLAMNAREAMKSGGSMKIETQEESDSNGSSEAARYALLKISDTGCGMPAEVCTHIFEPFYTTKGLVHASGLGLSTVYGMVKQNFGDIQVSSAPENGTTFSIRFPVFGKLNQASSEASNAGSDETATILVVENEKPIRELLCSELSQSPGYSVLAADGWRGAIDIALAHEGPIDLLITDVAMPEMDGRQIATRLKRECPEMDVIYMSRQNETNLNEAGIFPPGFALLQKPIDPGVLTQQVGKALARRAG